MSDRCVIGVDLGGTNVRACALRPDGTDAGPRFENRSHAQDGVKACLNAMIRTIKEAIELAKTPPAAIGLAIPGFVDNKTGVVRWAPNFGHMEDGILISWRNVEVRKPLEDAIGLPVHMGNDANLAALGEYKYGSGKGNAKCLVMLTLGTGIGGGVVLSPSAVDGDARGPLVLVGANQGGAELGHVVIAYQGVDCPSGEYGAIEGYCGRDSIVKRAQHRIIRGRQTIIDELVRGNLGDITPHTIFDAAEQGDEVAIEVFEEVGTMLGVGIGNYMNIFAPDVFAIGGQIIKAGDYIMKPALKAARNVAVATHFADCRVTVAEQLDDAGLLGAAAFAHLALGWS